ncbi:MAG: LysR family transcriptional regulator, partial [Rhizobiales bacterium]|nr:LysR family transcriptional regulator [Hyphomicrobiales bacterium]
MVEENKTLEFRELLAFSTVIQQGGITAAADNLNLSKSTISLQVSRLEQSLGVKLLERNSRRVALTREGENLLPRVMSLLEEMQLLKDESSLAASVPNGNVRIAVTPALGGFVLKTLIPHLRQTHPNMRLIVESAYQFDDLQDPNFDFAIRVGRIKDDTLVANHVGTFRRVLVASPAFIQEHAPTTPADLAQTPCLVFSGNSPEANWRLESAQHPQQTEVVLVQSHVAVRNFSVLLDLAKQGLGVALVPNFLANDA